MRRCARRRRSAESARVLLLTEHEKTLALQEREGAAVQAQREHHGDGDLRDVADQEREHTRAESGRGVARQERQLGPSAEVYHEGRDRGG